MFMYRLLPAVCVRRMAVWFSALLTGLLTALSVPAAAQSAAEVFQRSGHSVGIVLVGNLDGKLVSAGSAVAVDQRLMVTNFHVVTERPYRIYVFLNSRRYEASVYRCEKEQDLCLIDVQGLDVPAVEFANADDLKVGDTTFAIGGPNELLNALAVSAATNQKQLSPPQVTLSQGMVTALRPLADGTLIQTSAPISPGSSGGGLFDGKGRLIGITTFQMRNNQAVNFALPVAWVRRMGVSGGSPQVEAPAPLAAAGGGIAPTAETTSSPLADVAGTNPSPTVLTPLPTTSLRPVAKKPGLPLWPILLVVLIALLAAVSWLRRRHRPRRGFSLAMEQETTTAAPASAEADMDSETRRWEALVAKELAAGQVDEALWAAIQPYAVGDPEKARTLYAKRRIPQLIQAEKERLWREAVARSQAPPPPPPGRTAA